jgi:hypothetical protein
MIKMAEGLDVSTSGSVTFTARADCCYTITTRKGVVKPGVPVATAKSAAFPLPYSENFEGKTSGSEAPFFGDQEGKWETVPAGGGRSGSASQQQLSAWPIIEPQCNDHSQPVSIIGDLFFESTKISADVLLDAPGVGAGVALRVRNPGSYFRGVAPGLFLYLGSTPGVTDVGGRENPGGVTPPPTKPTPGWALCADSYCTSQVLTGKLPVSSLPLVAKWHSVQLEVTNNLASASIDGVQIFAGLSVSGHQGSSSLKECEDNTTIVTGKVIAG